MFCSFFFIGELEVTFRERKFEAVSKLVKLCLTFSLSLGSFAIFDLSMEESAPRNAFARSPGFLIFLPLNINGQLQRVSEWGSQSAPTVARTETVSFPKELGVAFATRCRRYKYTTHLFETYKLFCLASGQLLGLFH